MENQLSANGRSLPDLLKDVLRDHPETVKLTLIWQEQEEGTAPDMGLLLVVQAAAQDGLSGDIGSAALARNFTMEGGDGSADALSEMVYYIPGGLGLIIAVRRNEESEDELANRLAEELDEECEVECLKSRHKLNARRARPKTQEIY